MKKFLRKCLAAFSAAAIMACSFSVTAFAADSPKGKVYFDSDSYVAKVEVGAEETFEELSSSSVVAEGKTIKVTVSADGKDNIIGVYLGDKLFKKGTEGEGEEAKEIWTYEVKEQSEKAEQIFVETRETYPDGCLFNYASLTVVSKSKTADSSGKYAYANVSYSKNKLVLDLENKDYYIIVNKKTTAADLGADYYVNGVKLDINQFTEITDYAHTCTYLVEGYKGFKLDTTNTVVLRRVGSPNEDRVVWINGKDTKAAYDKSDKTKIVSPAYLYKTESIQASGQYAGGKWMIAVTPKYKVYEDIVYEGSYGADLNEDGDRCDYVKQKMVEEWTTLDLINALDDKGKLDKAVANEVKAIATAKLKNGVVTVTAGKVSGEIRVWIYEWNPDLKKVLASDVYCDLEGRDFEEMAEKVLTEADLSESAPDPNEENEYQPYDVECYSKKNLDKVADLRGVNPLYSPVYTIKVAPSAMGFVSDPSILNNNAGLSASDKASLVKKAEFDMTNPEPQVFYVCDTKSYYDRSTRLEALVNAETTVLENQIPAGKKGYDPEIVDVKVEKVEVNEYHRWQEELAIRAAGKWNEFSTGEIYTKYPDKYVWKVTVTPLKAGKTNITLQSVESQKSVKLSVAVK